MVASDLEPDLRPTTGQPPVPSLARLGCHPVQKAAAYVLTATILTAPFQPVILAQSADGQGAARWPPAGDRQASPSPTHDSTTIAALAGVRMTFDGEGAPHPALGDASARWTITSFDFASTSTPDEASSKMIWPDAVRKALRETRAFPASGQANGAKEPLGTEEKVGKALFSIGLAPLVIGLLLLSPYSKDKCSTPSLYSTPTCKDLRDTMIPLVTGGALAVLFGWAALVDGHNKRLRSASSGSSSPSGPSATGSGLASIHSSDAQAARQAIDQIRGGSHGDMPPPEVAGSSSRGRTTMAVTNGTGSVLSFYYAGPASGTLTLAPGAVQNLSLSPGRYELAARVSAPNVIPFYGVEDLLSATYTETFYIR
jgi:hypothetical protein